MVDSGTLRTKKAIDAFRGTDRATFLNEPSDPSVYVDMPLRQRLLHLSAPSIYATALEALELDEGHSFLNVGSGTGCARPACLACTHMQPHHRRRAARPPASRLVFLRPLYPPRYGPISQTSRRSSPSSPAPTRCTTA